MEEPVDGGRRTFLTLVGSSVTAAGIATGASGTEGTEARPLSDDPDIPSGTESDSDRRERRSYLVAQYGRPEGNIIQSVATRYRRRMENTGLSSEEAFRRAGDELIDHPKTSTVAEEIRERRALLDRLESDDGSDPDDRNGEIATRDFFTAVVGDRTSVSVTKAQQGRSKWGIGAADVATNVSARRMHANARVTGIGGASSYTRLYGTITPSQSIGGAVRMTVKFFRQGGVVGGNCRIKFFVRESARPENTMVLQQVDTPGFVQGSVTRSAQFTMPAGVKHDVGVQLETSVDTIASAYFYADYFTTVFDLSRRRVVLESPIKIESLD